MMKTAAGSMRARVVRRARMQIGMQAVCSLAVMGSASVLCTPVHTGCLKMQREQGRVFEKTINNGKLRAFLGIPYVASAVGDWRPQLCRQAAK